METPLSSSVESTNQSSKRRFSNPAKAYRRKPPHSSLVVKSLFKGRIPLSPMAQKPCEVNVFKPLDMSGIPYYPLKMLQNFEKWLLKFWACFQTHSINDEDGDKVM